MSCADAIALLELAPLELEDDPALEAAEAEALRAHLEGCADCRARAEAGRRAYETWTTLTEADMRPLDPALRTRVLEAFAAERAGAEEKKEPLTWPPQPADEQAVEAVRRKVALSCSFCRDRCAREEVVYCAECLAPHHLDCFRTHGRCTMPGCGTTLFVRPQEATPAPVAASARPPRQRGPWVALVGATVAAAGLGVAALLPGMSGGGGGGGYRGQITKFPPQVGEDFPRQGVEEPPSPTVQIEATDEPLGTVIDRLAADAGASVLVDPALRQRRLSVVARGPWREALRYVSLQVGATVDELPGGVLRVWTPPVASLQLGQVPLGLALDALAEQVDGNLLVEPRLRAVTVPATIQRSDWRQALRELADAAGGRVTWVGETALVTAQPPATEALAPIEALRDGAGNEVRLTYEAHDRPLAQVLRDLAGELHLRLDSDLILDRTLGDGPPIDVCLRGVPGRDALRAVALQARVALEELPSGDLWVRPAGARRLRAEGCPGQAWFELLGKAGRLEVSQTPSLRSLRVHTRLRDVGPLLALRLSALLHGVVVREVGTTLCLETLPGFTGRPEEEVLPQLPPVTPEQIELQAARVRGDLARGDLVAAHDASRVLRELFRAARGPEGPDLGPAWRALAATPEVLFRVRLTATAVSQGDRAWAVLESRVLERGAPVRESDGQEIPGLLLEETFSGRVNVQWDGRVVFTRELGE